MKRFLPSAALLFSAVALAVDPQPVRRVPPPGVPIPEADRASLASGVEALGKDLAALKHSLAGKEQWLGEAPDVEIFQKAVDWALRYDEFFDVKQVGVARKLLETGRQRATELAAGKPSWDAATGLVVRAYRSSIDGSIQPYGMVVPEDWKPGDKKPRRLDFWCHGRGEKLSELDFINQRQTSKGEFTPPGEFVLHLYGRYCCANKFAGEVDLFEALADARKHYPIDEARLVVRGFSMGGASAWQFGTHFAGLWAAVQPGAGFGESKEFLKLGTAPDKPLPPAWEQTLWHWYDSTDYVANLANTTTVAYSGEIDGQKQAADIMIRYAEKEGVKIEHVIGPKTPHKILPESKPEIEKLVGAAVEKGRDPFPKHLHFTTYTLVYPQLEWVSLSGLDKQWERADVDATINGAQLVIITKNVNAFALTGPFADGRAAAAGVKTANIDGEAVALPSGKGAPRFQHVSGHWKPAVAAAAGFPGTKHEGICGPIDHAFMSSFVFVRPTGKPLNSTVGAWVKEELDHAVTQWRQVFRGEAPVVDDTALSAAEIAKSNLILWGDPSSNAIWKKIADKLPVKWESTTLSFAGQTYDAAHHAPILIFPNPLNPEHYVAINTGFTFREAAALNNAQQTPKLPDWAIVDLATPPDANAPGRILRAGFFDEHWKVTPP